jgi:hypothetical protein
LAKITLVAAAILIAWTIHLLLIPWALIAMGVSGETFATQAAGTISTAFSSTLAILAFFRGLPIPRLKWSSTLNNEQWELALDLHVQNRHTRPLKIVRVDLPGFSAAGEGDEPEIEIEPGKGADVRLSFRPASQEGAFLNAIAQRKRLRFVVHARLHGSAGAITKRLRQRNPFREES